MDQQYIELFDLLQYCPFYIQQILISAMSKQCLKHNLPQQIICLGEMCHKRIGCQLCIDKHEHKFYLDTKCTQKTVSIVKQQIVDKITHLQKYTKANIVNLRLQNYKQKIEKAFENELVYFQNKIDEELLNINIWIERISKIVKSSLEQSKKTMLENWDQYYKNAQKHIESIKEYNELNKYFTKGDWAGAEHVEKSVTFLYSEELFFRFNRNLDALKGVINLHKKEDSQLLSWLESRRNQFVKLQICPHKNFQQIMKKYQNKPSLSLYVEPKAKQGKDDRTSIMEMIKEDSKAVLLYPQTMYQPFQNVYKLIRYDNSVFVTSGSRAINIWTRVSPIPQKSYPLNFPSYGILSFVEYGKDEAEQIVYGKSNGQLGLINMKKQVQSQMPAHESAIRDIIQFDSYHFLTASQDWKLKLWAMATEKQKQTKKNFAAERLTLTGHSGRIYTICKFGPSVLAAGSDGTIKLWDILRQSYDQVFQQQKQIYALTEIRPELFASGGQLKQLRVWDYRKTKAHACRFPIEHTCNTILRYDDNTLIFNDKNIIKVIDIRNTKQAIERMSNDKTYTHVVNSMAYLSDSQIGMGGNDNIISIWKY